MLASITASPLYQRIQGFVKANGVYLLLIAVTLLAYCNAFGGTFLLDDDILLVKNSFLRSWGSMWDAVTHNSTAGTGNVDNFYRPLQIALYVIVFQFFGLSSVAFHALNILLHVINVILVYKFGRKLNFNPTVVLIVSLLWAVHPVHVEAVTYMSATADTLFATFMLLGLLAWGPSWKQRGLTLLCYILCVLAKEPGIIFPALLMSVIAFQAKREDRLKVKTYLSTWHLWAFAALYMYLRTNVLNFQDTFHIYRTVDAYSQNIHIRFFTFTTLIPRYFTLLLVPFGLHMERYDIAFSDLIDYRVLWGVAWFSLCVWLAFIGVTGKPGSWQEKFKPLGWGAAWFIVAYFPCSGILISANALFLEHWMYVPSIGLFLGIAQTIANFFRFDGEKQLLGIALLLAYGGFLITTTLIQNNVWNDPITFYTHILKYEDGVARLHNNLGMAYQQQGDNRKAEIHYRKAIEVWDVYAQTHHNYGKMLLEEGKVDDAIAQFKRAVEIDPNFFRSVNALVVAYYIRKDKKNFDYWKDYYYKHKPFALPANEQMFLEKDPDHPNDPIPDLK